MLKNAMLREAIALTLVLMALTGLVYPGVVTGVAQLLFPHRASGSLITGPGGQVVGSALIAQQFTEAHYFRSRPSAGAGYNAAASAGTNKGATDLKLADTLVAQAVDLAVTQDGAVKGEIPSDLVTSSGSGLDPHISPAGAEVQVARVARSRGLPEASVRALVARYTEGRQFGFLGDPRVNVLLLNLALDSVAPMPSTGRN
jgi:K+-transporting ATPase ATPase C chain